MYPTPYYKRRLYYSPSPARTPFKRAKVTATKAANATRKNHPAGPRRTGTVLQQLRSLQAIVKKSLPEIKYKDIALDQTDIPNATGAVVHLTAIAQDDTVSTRTGNTIQIQSLNLSGYFVRQNTLTYTANGYYRIALVIDKQQVADTAPTIGDVFDYGAGASTRFLPKVAALERFRVLWVSEIFDPLRMVLNQNLTTASAGIPTQSTYFQYCNEKMNLRVDYNGSAITDIQKNGIYFLVLSSDTADVVDINGIARIGFIDA